MTNFGPYRLTQNYCSRVKELLFSWYTVAGKTIGFALEQPLHVVALACPASGILKQLGYKMGYWFMYEFLA
ncbi:MAG: hypothetical protein LBJ00_11020 [Planctomycetaceae bacterium]|jgi:hypothetical protein|nr:hypothetical protein [Planctomycetaceae bacterium]